MYRKIVTPTETQLILDLPLDFIGHEVEVIAFTTDEGNKESETRRKKTIEEAIAFYRKNAVDFSKVKKWTREDLYDRD